MPAVKTVFVSELCLVLPAYSGCVTNYSAKSMTHEH